MILAELPSGWGTVGSIAELGGFLCSVVVMIAVLANKSQKREITLSPEAITRREFEEARRIRDLELAKIIGALERHIEVNRHEHAEVFKKVGGVERGAREDLRLAIDKQNEGRAKLHDQMNDVLKALGRIEGRQEQ